MKNLVLGAAVVVLTCGSLAASAAEKPTLEERCRAIAEQHGMQPQEIAPWVERCMDHTKAMMHRHKDDEQNSGGPGQQSNDEQKRNGDTKK